MNVTLPDGTVLTDIPDGTTKAQLLEKLTANGYDMSKLADAPSKPAQKESILDAPNAAATGMLRGYGVGLAGAPMDTAVNIAQLGQAGIGSLYTAATGKEPPEILQLRDRSEMPGTSAWLLKQAGKNKFSSALVNPANPDYEGGYLQAAGGAMAGATNPAQAAMSVAGATAGKAVGDATGNQALAITASLLAPSAAKASGVAGEYVADKMQGGAKKLMQSALKPTIAQLRSGEAQATVDTLLKHGINPTKGGVDKMRGMVGDLNDQIAKKIADSTATVSREKVIGSLDGVRSKFANQVNPEKDLEVIQNAANEFKRNPAFSNYEPSVEALRNALAKTKSEKETALQAAGKLQTMAAQQKSLADGATFRLAKDQPEFQPYYNTGGLGRDVTSTSSLPVPGYPRIPGRYTHNIDRVPEGEAGAKEAIAIFNAKKLQEAAAASALADLQAAGATMPVQLAQKMKQGTYQVLAKKYGQIGSADTEAQKGLARGLKEEIAKAVPDVGALNAKESELINALNVSERRALMDMNKNPMGLAGLAHSPAAWAAFMADKSALFKSLAARALNTSSAAPRYAGGALGGQKPIGITPEEQGALSRMLLTSGVLDQ